MSFPATKRKAAQISEEQKSELVRLIADNTNLRIGQVSSFTEADKAWEEVSLLLNAIPGPKLNWFSWRKVWQDIYSKAKAENNQSQGQTELEKAVAAIVRSEDVSRPTIESQNETETIEGEKSEPEAVIPALFTEVVYENESDATEDAKTCTIDKRRRYKENKRVMKRKHSKEKLQLARTIYQVLQSIDHSVKGIKLILTKSVQNPCTPSFNANDDSNDESTNGS